MGDAGSLAEGHSNLIVLVLIITPGVSESESRSEEEHLDGPAVAGHEAVLAGDGAVGCHGGESVGGHCTPSATFTHLLCYSCLHLL